MINYRTSIFFLIGLQLFAGILSAADESREPSMGKSRVRRCTISKEDFFKFFGLTFHYPNDDSDKDADTRTPLCIWEIEKDSVKHVYFDFPPKEMVGLQVTSKRLRRYLSEEPFHSFWVIPGELCFYVPSIMEFIITSDPFKEITSKFSRPLIPNIAQLIVVAVLECGRCEEMCDFTFLQDGRRAFLPTWGDVVWCVGGAFDIEGFKEEFDRRLEDTYLEFDSQLASVVASLPCDAPHPAVPDCCLKASLEYYLKHLSNPLVSFPVRIELARKLWNTIVGNAKEKALFATAIFIDWIASDDYLPLEELPGAEMKQHDSIPEEEFFEGQLIYSRFESFINILRDHYSPFEAYYAGSSDGSGFHARILEDKPQAFMDWVKCSLDTDFRLRGEISDAVDIVIVDDAIHAARCRAAVLKFVLYLSSHRYYDMLCQEKKPMVSGAGVARGVVEHQIRVVVGGGLVDDGVGVNPQVGGGTGAGAGVGAGLGFGGEEIKK